LFERIKMSPITKEELETPALLIDLDLLEYNIASMAKSFSSQKTKLRPHFKTHKCPIISHKQINAGAKGITCAKLGEAETLVFAGIKDVLIANTIVQPSKIIRLANLAHGDTKISVATDNLQNIESLSEAAITIGSTLHVLVEVDIGMERCGVNTPEEVLLLAQKIIKAKGLKFEGIQAYEGHLVQNTDIDTRRQGVLIAADKLKKIKEFIERNGITINQVSGGGTGTYNLTGNNLIWTEVQAGSYIFMDTIYERLGLKFKNALSILATVIHKRSGMAVTDAGLKVCSTENGSPRVKYYPELKFYDELSEEHGTIVDPKDELTYLQKLEYIPSHCCTTVNLHDFFYCIRNDNLECVWPILARGKSQ